MIRTKFLATCLLGLVPFTATAQQDQILPLILNVTRGSPATPGNVGFLRLAEVEAASALEQADLALAAEDLEAMQSHMRRLLTAMDPKAGQSGTATRTGLIYAAAAINANLSIARAMEEASINLKTQADRAIVSSDNVIEWSQIVAETTETALQSSSIEVARKTMVPARLALNDIIYGKDADGDGKVGWQRGEGGLQQVREYVEYLAKGEGLTPGFFKTPE